MNAPKRSRARVLTPDGLKKLQKQLRSREIEENSGNKYTLEKLSELTGLDPETVKNVLDRKGSDKRTLSRCFTSFGLTLTDEDHIPAAQAIAVAADPNFVGRDEAIADLNQLVSQNYKAIVIQARGGVGKTTLARKYLQQEFGTFLEFPIAKETKDIASIEGLLEEKLRQLGEEPGREFLVSIDRLKRKLQSERIGILIDNLEPALDSTGKFIEPHRRYVELLRVLSDPTVQSTTLITTRERLREPDITVQHYLLKSLEVNAWVEFFQSRNITILPIVEGDKKSQSVLTDLHHAYGGNAKAMDIICGAILEDFSGNVHAYWQANQDDLLIERDLEDLVVKQFERLQQLDPDAYNLLCRMGCYRYQDVPTVPIEGLFCLLWDIPENRHRRVIKSLQDRSLVDFENGEFWLHPVVREEAISRLRRSRDWEISNQAAIESWTKSVKSVETIKDALIALEAYYHCIAISDFSMAAIILIKQRPNKWESKWENGEYLGASLYRLGLLHQPILAINSIKNEISIGFPASRLYNILGDLFWLSGQPRKAIECHDKSWRIAKEAIKFTQEGEVLKWLTILEAIALFNIGLCKIDLWEIQEALSYTEGYISTCESNDYKSHFPEGFSLEDCFSCLAFLGIA